MTLRKLMSVVLVASLTLLLASTPLLAAKANPALEKAAKEALKLLGGKEGLTMMKNVALLKKAGLSYQPSLTVPLDGVIDCKSKENLRVLLGMYLFDTNYAAVFGKKKEMLDIRAMVAKKIPDKLEVPGLSKAKQLPADKLKKISQQPDKKANREALLKNWMAEIDTMFKAAAKDPKLMDVLMDATYGLTIEGVYVSCKLAQSAGPGDTMLALFNYNIARLTSLAKALDAFAADKELAAMVELGQRQKVIGPVLKIYNGKRAKLDQGDVAKILAIVEPVRSPLVKKCQ
jgi:hypothetical protein